jgi:methionyl aminopeptidase
MLNLGHNWDTLHWPDDWTATTVDGKRSAQFEETLLYVAGVPCRLTSLTPRIRITETGVEVLTAGSKRADLYDD